MDCMHLKEFMHLEMMLYVEQLAPFNQKLFSNKMCFCALRYCLQNVHAYQEK